MPSGIMFDIHREAAAKRPGVLTKVGMETFVDPLHEGCAMNAKAAADPIVKRVAFAGEDWLFFPTITKAASSAQSIRLYPSATTVELSLRKSSASPRPIRFGRTMSWFPA